VAAGPERLVTNEDEDEAALRACPGFRSCALCRAVVAKRTREATIWHVARSLRAERRCWDCGWCHEEHTPDCGEEAINRRYEAALADEESERFET